MSHKSAASSPCSLCLQSHFPILSPHYFPSHSVDAQNLSYSIRTANKTGKNEGITFLHAVTQRVDFCISNSISLLLLPAAEPCLPACHPFSSILLQTQQSIICFLSLRHCQHATRQDGSNSSRYSSWPAVSPSLCATANTRCPQLRSLSSSSAPSSEGVFIF